MMYLYRRGPCAKRRKMHLCGHDSRTGKPTMIPLCGTDYPCNTTINVPLGQKVCRRCQREAQR